METVELARLGEYLDASQTHQYTGSAMHSREYMAGTFIAKALRHFYDNAAPGRYAEKRRRFPFRPGRVHVLPRVRVLRRDRTHEALVKGCHGAKLAGHVTVASTVIEGGERACRKSEATRTSRLCVALPGMPRQGVSRILLT